jgi:AcrR family transcriptional regulator
MTSVEPFEIPPTRSTRQWLSKRQSATVATLLGAGLDLLREVGYEQLTIRAVAGRAGVTHTTAYAYFSSKGHLVAEMLWRRLEALPAPVTEPSMSLPQKISEALRDPGLLLADEPALSQAALAALLTQDPDVSRLRDTIGTEIVRRIEHALDGAAEPDLTEALTLAFSGAMLQAGMGYFDFSGVVSRMSSVAELLERSK